MHAKRTIAPGMLLSAVLATTAASAQCDAPASWTSHATIPQPDNIDPGTDHCNFHRWSWQTFLWLTQRVNGDLRFITQMSSDFTPFNVTDFKGANPPGWLDRRGGTLRLRPRDTKPVAIRSKPLMNQPGDNGILIDQQGHAVYFAIHINKIYFDFIVKRQYYDPDILEKASPVDKFPVGTLEVKSAWRIVNDGEDTSGFYTTTAEIQPLQATPGGVTVVEDPSKSCSKTVALVGFHVAGVLEGHPEFVWATFEHQRNAPVLAPGMTMSSPKPVSDTSALFYAADTPAAQSNRPNDGQVTLIDAKNQTLKPITQVVREIAWGGGGDVARIQSLNASVHKMLLKADAMDRAASYNLIGSLWVDKGVLQPNQIPGEPDRQRGSIRLANTTMETFRQSVGNCFSCHDTRNYKDMYGHQVIDFPAMDLNLSHALRRSYVLNRQSLKRLGQKGPGAPSR